MKSGVLTAVFLLISCLSFALDFRSSSWGDSKEDVIRMEGKPSYESIGDSGWNRGLSIMHYEDVTVLNRLATAIYWFSNDSLVMGRYALGGTIGFFEYELDEVFAEFTKALTQKYGSAQYYEGSAIWLTDRGLISLWKVKREYGTTVLLDYCEKEFYLTHVANRVQCALLSIQLFIKDPWIPFFVHAVNLSISFSRFVKAA